MNIDQAKYFENAAQNWDFKVKAFTAFKDAIIWLLSVTPLTEDQSYEHSTSH